MKAVKTSGSHDGATTASPIYREVVLEPLFSSAKTHNGFYQAIDRAHVVMLVETGILPRESGRSLLAALGQLDRLLALETRTDADRFEDLFFLREDRLRSLVGADLAGRLHTGRSRNDLEATVFRLQLRERLGHAIGQVADLAATVVDLARGNSDTVILAYTHGQPAQPTTYGHYLAAFGEILLRDLARLESALADVDRCPLGAAAITTTGFPVDRERVARLLGFGGVQENTYGCIAAVDQFVAAYGALRLVFLNVGRLAQDLAFWTAFEVGQARASDGFVQISSIMPQKRNPLAIEHIRTMASLGGGHCTTVVEAVHNTPFADMVDAEGPTQAAGLQAFAMLGRVVPLLGAFLSELEIDAARVAANIDASCATMTELADSLVRLEGISFRQAHDVAAALARDLIRDGQGTSSLRGEQVADTFAQVVGRRPTLATADLRRLASPEYSIAVRERPGGPGPGVLADCLLRQAAELAGVRDRRAEARLREATAVAALDGAVSTILAG